MNAHDSDRSRLVAAVRDVEASYPLHVLGLLPRGAAPHVFGENALDLLAEKRPGLSLFSLSGAEVDLAERLGRPVGIVLTSELRGAEAVRLTEAVRPL